MNVKVVLPHPYLVLALARLMGFCSNTCSLTANLEPCAKASGVPLGDAKSELPLLVLRVHGVSPDGSEGLHLNLQQKNDKIQGKLPLERF